MAWLVDAFIDDVIARLKSYKTLAGASVYDSDPTPPDTADLPSLVVMVPQEDSTLLSTAGGPSLFKTMVHLVIRATVAGNESEVAPLMRQLVGQVTDGLFLDPTWILHQLERVPSKKIICEITPQGDVFVGEAMILLVCERQELFQIIPTGTPATVDMTATNMDGFQETISLNS